ncbi:unnamed protein product [Camellia sinensis]
MEIDEYYTLRHYIGPPDRHPAHLWRKVSIVLLFPIRLSLLHRKQRDQYRPSSSSSSALRSPGKVACICVWTIDKYEWYAFDVSDDIKHNQTPPPAKYINYPIPFHEDDESGVVNLKPQVTAIMDWILGWEILDAKTLYILDDWKGQSASGESNRVDCIDLSRIGFYPWEWEPVQNMPNQITASAHTCVLGGKFYCLGGGHRSQKVESVEKSRLAMPYYLSLKAGTSPPPPPCLDLDKILSAFKEVPKPYLPSQNLELEGQSPYSESERYVHKQLSKAITVAITKRYVWDQTIYICYRRNLSRDNCSLLSGFFVQQKYYVEKLFYHNYVRQKYFHKKLISAIKYAQPCLLSLKSAVMDYFLKAVSLVEEFFRSSVENCQQILKTFHMPFYKPLVEFEEFQKKSFEEFQKNSFEESEEFEELYMPPAEDSEDFEDFELPLAKDFEDFLELSTKEFKEFLKPSVENFRRKLVKESLRKPSKSFILSVEEQVLKQSVEEFPKPSVEEFPKPSVEEFPKRAVEEFPKPSVEEFPKPSVEEFRKPSVEEFLEPWLPWVEEFFNPRFPSQNKQLEMERQSPWVVAYDTRQHKWESLLDPPYRPIKTDNIFTAAREFPNQCFVVGLPEDCLLQIYHVNAQQWEIQEFKICPKFGPKVLTGPALSVDSKLYWYSVDDHCLVGYDLVTKMWFVGNFPIHDHGEHFGVLDVDTPPRLAHLGGDNFCLLWVSVLQHKSMNSSESKDNCISRLHCMKLQVTTGNIHPESGIISLEVSILSCQSHLASGLKFFRGGLVWMVIQDTLAFDYR